MSTLVEVAVPDIGDFTDVPVVELLVAVGDAVELESPLVELESDKASFEVPSTAVGTVKEIKVAVGDKVSEGTVLVVVETSGAGGADASEPDAGAAKTPAPTPTPTAATAKTPPPTPTPASAEATPAPTPKPTPDFERSATHAQVLVLGSGPGGYSAAFRAADLGFDVVLVERYAALGGVCLNVGCIPSKALLHIAKVMAEAAEVSEHGIQFGEPEVDLDALRVHKDDVVGKLTQGVAGMAQRRKVRVLQGEGRFTSPHHLEVVPTGDDAGDPQAVSFDHAIIAAGSKVVRIPGIPYDDPRVWDSTAALELREIPDRLLVIGGGIIGLEMATVYDALGSAVTVVELSDGLIPGCDRDLVKPLQQRIAARYAAIHTGVRVDAIEPTDDALIATFAASDGGDAPAPAEFDAVLVAVGRAANGNDLGLHAAGVTVNERGQIEVDVQRRTNIRHIFAIGDLTPGPMLAHKATHEGHVAAEAIAGEPGAAFDVRGIPSVAYTDPEIAWVGLTETQAKADGTAYETAVFPWVASGRALASGGASGRTKLLVDPTSRRVLGAGIVGPNAGELIAEPGFALEMGADVGDIALTIHAHPTLSESVGLAAEVAEGTVTDLPPQRRRKAT